MLLWLQGGESSSFVTCRVLRLPPHSDRTKQEGKHVSVSSKLSSTSFLCALKNIGVWAWIFGVWEMVISNIPGGVVGVG